MYVHLCICYSWIKITFSLLLRTHVSHAPWVLLQRVISSNGSINPQLADASSFQMLSYSIDCDKEQLRPSRRVKVAVVQNAIVKPTTDPMLDQYKAIEAKVTPLRFATFVLVSLERMNHLSKQPPSKHTILTNKPIVRTTFLSFSVSILNALDISLFLFVLLSYLVFG